MPEFFHDFKWNAIVGDTDTYCFLLALDQFWHIVACIQDKRERPGQVFTHHFENLVADRATVVSQLAQVIAYKREVCFVSFYSFNLSDALHRPGFEDIATKPVNGVSGINDNSAVHKAFSYCSDLTWAGVFRVYFE